MDNSGNIIPAQQTEWVPIKDNRHRVYLSVGNEREMYLESSEGMGTSASEYPFNIWINSLSAKITPISIF